MVYSRNNSTARRYPVSEAVKRDTRAGLGGGRPGLASGAALMMRRTRDKEASRAGAQSVRAAGSIAAVALVRDAVVARSPQTGL
jgi:hypothetical protein